MIFLRNIVIGAPFPQTKLPKFLIEKHTYWEAHSTTEIEFKDHLHKLP